MSSTVAVDAARVEGWRREPTRAADAPMGASSTDPHDHLADGKEPIVVPAWPRRRLPDALAERQGRGSDVPTEPWSRARTTTSRGDSDGSTSPSAAATTVPSAKVGTIEAISAGSSANGHLPSDVAHDPAGTFSPADPRRWGVHSLGDTDAAENEIVLALAGFDRVPISEFDQFASSEMEREPQAVRTHALETEERPPMIIERALAEQRMGILAVPALTRPSPVPGLAIGFSLSIAAGAALYIFMAVG